MRHSLLLPMCAVSVRQSVHPSVCSSVVRHAAQLGFTVRGSFSAAFAKSVWPLCLLLWRFCGMQTQLYQFDHGVSKGAKRETNVQPKTGIHRGKTTISWECIIFKLRSFLFKYIFLFFSRQWITDDISKCALNALTQFLSKNWHLWHHFVKLKISTLENGISIKFNTDNGHKRCFVCVKYSLTQSRLMVVIEKCLKGSFVVDTVSSTLDTLSPITY